MPAFPFMELALCMALWTIARQLRTFTKPEILSGWRGLALSPVRLVAVIAAKLSGFMTIGFFVFGLMDRGWTATAVAAFAGFAVVYAIGWAISLCQQRLFTPNEEIR